MQELNYTCCRFHLPPSPNIQPREFKDLAFKKFASYIFLYSSWYDQLFLFFIFNLKLSSFWVKVKLPNLYMWQLHDLVNQGGGSRLCGIVMGITCCLFCPDVAFCATSITSVKFWSLSYIALYHAKAGLWQKVLNTQYLLLVLILPVLGQ